MVCLINRQLPTPRQEDTKALIGCHNASKNLKLPKNARVGMVSVH